MDRYGQAYAHAVYVQETTVREFNEERQQATPLVAIEPADGTFVADYPLIALDAPWVSAEARAAAQAFRGWLVPKITAKNAAESGFRIRRPTGLAELEPPEPEVLAAIRDAWHEDRKPANIVLVVDTSSSMGEAGRLDAAKQGLLSFVRELSPEDRVALVTSGDSIETNVRLGVPSESRPGRLQRSPRSLPERRTRPSTRRSPVRSQDVRALDDPDRINAVVVLSDGAGTSVGRRQLLRTIRAEPVTEGTERPHLQRRLRRRRGRRGAPADRVRLGRRILHRKSEGDQGRLPKHLRPISEATVREIGRYRVEREIGRGGMAIVHLARQADLERSVALKELAGLWATDPTATTRFLREARLGGSLNHPNIVTVHEYFEHGGVPYIAMEFLAARAVTAAGRDAHGSAGRRRARRHPRRSCPRRRARDRAPGPQA